MTTQRDVAALTRPLCYRQRFCTTKTLIGLAVANRLQGVADQFPLFSEADEALWLLAGSYHRMGDKFEEREAQQYTKIVKDLGLKLN